MHSFEGAPTELDFEKSLMFFHAYMYGPLQGKLRIYGARDIPAGPAAMSTDWEVFASMLVKDLGRKLGAGVDLQNNEVKSAKTGAGYEYQFHKMSGRENLARVREVGHLFFEYTETLSRVDLRYLHGTQLRSHFDKWLAEYPEPYPQRYRKQIPYGFIRKNALLLMTIEDGEVTAPPRAPNL